MTGVQTCALPIWPIVQEEVSGHPLLNAQGVPKSVDFATTDEQRKVLELGYAQEIIGRPYFMVEEVPRERVDAMRKAFADTFQDQGFLAEARKLSLGVTAPKTGLEIQKLVEDTYRAPPKVIDRLRKLSLH